MAENNIFRNPLEYDCIYCARYDFCDLEDIKDHWYNLRDHTKDCFTPDDKKGG